MDALQKQTDVDSFAVLEPAADGFRNYIGAKYDITAEELLIDKARLLTMIAPPENANGRGTRVDLVFGFNAQRGAA